MPALKIKLNGQDLVTVSTQGLNVLAVRASGTRLGPDRCAVHVHGGVYPAAGESTDLTWVNDAPLAPGDRLEVHLLADGATSQRGKTLDELFPGEALSGPEELKPKEVLFSELEQMPSVFARIGLHFASSSLGELVGAMASDEHGYAFSVVWDSYHPTERARVSLHTFTLRALAEGEPLTHHVQGLIHCGDWVVFEVGA